MKKIVFIVLACAVLASCGKADQLIAHYTGWSRVCVAGVSYLQFTSGVTVEYTPEGKIKRCD